MSAQSSDKLCPEDQKAVDFAMSRQDASAGNTPYIKPEPTMGQRIQAVEKCLRLISQMPEEPMPKDLVARVLERIADPDAAQTTVPSPEDLLHHQQQSRGNQA